MLDKIAINSHVILDTLSCSECWGWSEPPTMKLNKHDKLCYALNFCVTKVTDCLAQALYGTIKITAKITGVTHQAQGFYGINYMTS